MILFDLVVAGTVANTASAESGDNDNKDRKLGISAVIQLAPSKLPAMKALSTSSAFS